MPKYKQLIFAIFLLAFGMGQATALASDPQGRFPFQTYSRESGLENLRINLILQDKAGFIWVGTDDGAYRFDGHRFQAFGLEQGLPSLEINAFQLDASGSMWVGTKLGPARWNGDRFESGFKGYPDKLTVNEFILGPSQELWIATKEGVFRGTAAGFQAVSDWKNGDVKSLALGLDGATVWAGTNSQVWTWRAEHSWKLFPGSPVHEPKELLDRLFAGPDGRIWARTRNANYVLEPGAQNFTLIPELPAADSFLSRFHLGADGAVWIPTEKGIYRYHNGHFSNIGLIDGLPTDFTRAVLLDREGNLWCGSVGLHRLMGKGAWRSHTPKEGLPTVVWSIFRDRSGQLWSGTQKGLAQANEHGWRVIPGTESIQVRSITQSADGSLIFGGDPYGLWRWDGVKLHALPPLPASNGRKVLSLLMDQSERLWVATLQGGLLVASASREQWTYQQVTLPAAHNDEIISYLLMDRQGRLWATADHGLLMYASGKWHMYGTNDGLLSSNIVYVNQGRDDDIWVAYRDKPGTISRFKINNEKGKVVQTINPPRLSPFDTYLVGEDKVGRLWVGSNHGIDLLSTPRAAQGMDTHFGVEHGIADEDSNAMAFLAEENGEVWIGTRGGLSHFDSSKYGHDLPPPQVAILSSRIGSVAFEFSRAQKVVTYDQNTFEIAFAGLSFLDVNGVELQSRLIGLEDQWHNTPTREARYPSLRPGTYTMEIRARFRKGIWGPVTSQSFQILPPWWQTWWFRTLLALGIIGFAIIYDRRRVYLLKQQTRELEALVALRTSDLEIANKALRDQSLTDPLTGLRNRRYLTEIIPEHILLVDRSSATSSLSGEMRVSACNDLILITIDIDHFKFVNDTYGHPAGDKVLTQVATILRECTRESDTVARWGGEEFIVVAHQSSHRNAFIVMERIRTRFESQEFDLGGGQFIKRTCSMGFAFYPFFSGERHGVSWEHLLDMADKCLYVAKRNGRNAWVGLSPRDENDVGGIRHRIPHDLVELVKEGALVVQTSIAESSTIKWNQDN